MQSKDITDHFWKIYNCINSCTSKDQLKSCVNMVNTFENNFDIINTEVFTAMFNLQIKYKRQTLIQ